ncbi:MAG: ribonuclease HII [Candidatus Riflebacteria bacterium]|nr:ribonuclease HII [Candidatus Riflebacteria bacterium]
MRNMGYRAIAGGDEAGRGPWAGPVFAAFVVLPEKYDLSGLNDSKKLSRQQRQRLFTEITEKAIDYGISSAEAHEIDEMNILEATRLAFYRAFEKLKKNPDFLLLDFIKLPKITVPSLSLVKGDSLSNSIAAASILAKESRDVFMENLDNVYPGYDFKSHKGYGTPSHIKALANIGVSPVHRKSFKPVKKLL